MGENNFRDFHATNPFGNEIETMIRWDTLTENLPESTIADMFSELMFDYIPNSEQNTEITAAAERPGSSPASPDSTNPVDGAGNSTQNDAWPPLEVTDCSLEEWPNSNNNPLCEIVTTEEDALQHSSVTTPVTAPRTPMIHRNPSGSHASTNSTDRNPFWANMPNQQSHPRHRTNRMKTNQPTLKITHCGVSSGHLRRET